LGFVVIIVARYLFGRDNGKSVMRSIADTWLVAIIFIIVISVLVLASLNTARDRSISSVIHANLSGVRTNAELYYGDQGNSYGKTTKSCFEEDTLFTSKSIGPAVKEIVDQSQILQRNFNKTICVLLGSNEDKHNVLDTFGNVENIRCGVSNSGEDYAVSVNLYAESRPFVCVDSTGFSGITDLHIDSEEAKCVERPRP